MISLIHPSFGRPLLAKQAHDEWQSKCNDWNDIEYILSLDKRDSHLSQYENIFASTNVKIIISDSKNCVEATNIAAQESTGGILLYLSDDFGCPQNWDVEINKRLIPDHPMLLKVNDDLQHMNATVLTIPIMTRALYNQLGYMWCPEYESMSVDVDLWFETKQYHVLAPDLHFEHRHYSAGKSTYDDTYQQHDNKERNLKGIETLNRRKSKFGWKK